ncbi:MULTISPECIES: endonuclease VII domain-containing protein [Pseudofrankia]|uniref:endonuclease VII domain-containing protein n=1 Tax=Pseudofrankia TaxID=2994363 RepID=UPI000234D802
MSYDPEARRTRRQERYRRRKEADPRHGLTRNLWSHYGITIEEWDRLLIASCGLCAICARPFRNTPKEPHVDHNHRTGVVRDLLCAPCNRRLEALEAPGFVRAAHAYLLLHRQAAGV